MGSKKRVPQQRDPHPQKNPRCIPGTSRPTEEHIAWRFELICREPCYGWDTLTADDHKTLNEHLATFESMTVNQLFNNSGYPCKTYAKPHDIPDETARKRFLEQYDDQDEIHRLRCSGTKRVYGFRQGNIFMILWWDPTHIIWPSTR
ncbi:MAG: hypothetical protein JXA57_04435 [Armatimonadetes bacterium]|nr:hypothetical protein [Armatimonadota bacterium]